MNCIKRKVDIHEPSKKLKVVLNFENLANEIFYDIFEYLDGYDIFKAFSKLNHRFKRLLNISSFPLKFKLSYHSNEQICRDCILPNRHRLITLDVSNYKIINWLFSSIHVNQSFSQLQCIILRGIYIDNLPLTLSFLKSLPQLSSLIIKLVNKKHYDVKSILSSIFQLVKLKNVIVRVSMSTYFEKSTVDLPISIDKNYNIETMKFGLPLNLNELAALISHAPNLRRLTCNRLTHVREIYGFTQRLTESYLTYLSIDECFLSIDNLHRFLQIIGSQLRVLCLKDCGNYYNYILPNRWQSLIETYMPNLVRFEFGMHDSVNYDGSIPLHPEIINSYVKPFWTNKQWIFHLEFDYNGFICSIYPYQYNLFQ